MSSHTICIYQKIRKNTISKNTSNAPPYETLCKAASSYSLGSFQACLSLSEKLEVCQGDLDEANQTIEDLKTTLAKQDMNLDQSKLFVVLYVP